MTKGIKWVLVLGIFVVGVVLIITNIVENQYATVGGGEDQLEATEERVPLEEEVDKQSSEEDQLETAEEAPSEEELDKQPNKVDSNPSKNEAKETTSEHTLKEESEVQEAVETMVFINDILLVNKTYGLPSDYNPGEDREAVDHLNQMIKAAKEEEGLIIQSVSGFRSYSYQKGLYERYVKRDGEKKASTYSAKPGHSEHQTGLAFDIGGTDKSKWVNDSFDGTKEAKWLAKNAHRFGFILRYPKGKTDITGYKYEPWHFRYVGLDHAKEIYERGITLEEYLLGDVY